MNLLYVYESFLYYCCLLLITYYVFGCDAKKESLFFSFFIFAPLCIIALYGNTILTNISLLIFTFSQFLLIKLIFRKAKLRYVLFFYILLTCISVIAIGIFFMLFPTYQFQIDWVINTISAAFCVLICFSKCRFKIRKIMEWTPGYVLAITSFLMIISTFLSISVFGVPYSAYKNIWNTLLHVLLILTQFAVCLTSPVLIFNAVSNKQLKAKTKDYEHQIQVQSEHYKNLAAANHDVRRFKHDFKNISIAIEKLLADGKQEQALDLIRKYSGTMENVSPAFDTGNGIADALLTDKQKAASSCNAKITFQGAIPQDVLSPTDLCVILGNTLDNAIEACQKLPPEMSKTISVTCQCSSGFLFVSIENPVAKKVAVTDNHIFTTKDNKTLHGFGLYSLQSVVKKYSGEVKLTATDDLFTVDIDLCLMDTAALS